jgi:hypothetical protein
MATGSATPVWGSYAAWKRPERHPAHHGAKRATGGHGRSSVRGGPCPRPVTPHPDTLAAHLVEPHRRGVAAGPAGT